jgi:hypothetical protein
MANTVAARDWFRLIFKAYCKTLEKEHGKLILHCDMQWLSRGNFCNVFDD